MSDNKCQKYDEIVMVSFGDASAEPRAMMIVNLNTSFTFTTME